MRNILDIIKGNKNNVPVVGTAKENRAVPVAIDQWQVKTYDKSILEMDVTLACIDAIASNVAKIKFQPVVRRGGISTPDTTSDIARVLKHPNRYMTSYDFIYKVVALLLSSDNAFIYPEYDQITGKLVNLWPISYETFQLVTGSDKKLYAQFRLNYFRTYTAPYEELIHLRRHYITNDLFGDSHEAIKPICALIETQNQGIINGIKNSAIIRGILKATGVLKEQDLKKAREQFVKDNLSAQNNGGVITIDGKFDYKQLDSKPYAIDADTMEQSKRKILDYFHISPEFLESSYTSEQYEAVYESVLEPLILSLTQALTHGLYTSREIAFGSEIEAEVSKLKYQPISTIKEIIASTSQLGLFTRDEYRGMLGYTPLGKEKGGDVIMVAVNNYKSDNTQNKNDLEGSDDEEEKYD